jgi:hypothetical protein
MKMPGFFSQAAAKSPASEELSGKVQATFIAIRLGLRSRGRCLYCFPLCHNNLWGLLPASFIAFYRRAGLNFLFVN